MVLVFSFVCYTCEIARIDKPCVVALNILFLILFISSFYSDHISTEGGHAEHVLVTGTIWMPDQLTTIIWDFVDVP